MVIRTMKCEISIRYGILMAKGSRRGTRENSQPNKKKLLPNGLTLVWRCFVNIGNAAW